MRWSGYCTYGQFDTPLAGTCRASTISSPPSTWCSSLRTSVSLPALVNPFDRLGAPCLSLPATRTSLCIQHLPGMWDLDHALLLSSFYWRCVLPVMLRGGQHPSAAMNAAVLPQSPTWHLVPYVAVSISCHDLISFCCSATLLLSRSIYGRAHNPTSAYCPLIIVLMCGVFFCCRAVR